ncbi:MAG: beta-Ala-His dipeptidase, partial [Lentisphaeria bacterium]|nr:beta-Ala-His dipeptidase [Lentisphaeria bacterium]
MSQYEEGVRNWLIDLCKLNDWSYKTDEMQNICIYIEGRGTLKESEILVLQGHMDMVCEKNSNKTHDFYKDPIDLQIDGDWVKASDTTLGADNGVAIALGLGLASEDMPDRIPLELLFTVEEETGLYGALGLDPKIVSGKRILNLDSEEDGVFTIGCAGGADLDIVFKATGTVENVPAIKVCISGLRGGHSGVDIHENRAHAVKIALEIMSDLDELSLYSFNSGNKRNAIPREAEFIAGNVNEDKLQTSVATIIQKYQDKDKGIAIAIETLDYSGPEFSQSLLQCLSSIPIGVMSMDASYEELVESSNSIGLIETSDNTMAVVSLIRSSSLSLMLARMDEFKALVESAGGEYSYSGLYPGWQPNADSKLLSDAKEVYKNTFGDYPRVEGIHAGLEAGIIGEKVQSNELLAYGPTIQGAHSP